MLWCASLIWKKTFLVIRCVPWWQAGRLLSRWISSPGDAADHFTSTTFPDRKNVSGSDEKNQQLYDIFINFANYSGKVVKKIGLFTAWLTGGIIWVNSDNLSGLRPMTKIN